MKVLPFNERTFTSRRKMLSIIVSWVNLRFGWCLWRSCENFLLFHSSWAQLKKTPFIHWNNASGFCICALCKLVSTWSIIYKHLVVSIVAKYFIGDVQLPFFIKLKIVPNSNVPFTSVTQCLFKELFQTMKYHPNTRGGSSFRN